MPKTIALEVYWTDTCDSGELAILVKHFRAYDLWWYDTSEDGADDEFEVVCAGPRDALSRYLTDDRGLSEADVAEELQPMNATVEARLRALYA